MNTSDVIPSAYRGREQALVKHKLLSSYLEKLVLIIGMAGRHKGLTEICYVDCFAGPWGDESEEIKSTSIAISLGILEKCREELGARGANVRMRALFIEKSGAAFSRLTAYLTSRSDDRVSADCLHGDFVELRSKIVEWCGSQAFAFFFIDPKGWMEVGVEVLKPLLQRPRSEFLINFQYDFINRAASIGAHQANIAELVGETADVEGLSPEDREETLIESYRSNLKRKMHGDGNYPPRSAYVRVLDPSKDRLKYHLVYLTSHPRGIIEFMQKSEEADFTQQLIRATKKSESRESETGTLDMFGARSLLDGEPRRVLPGEVDRHWIQYLAAGPKKVDAHEFARILEDTNWFPGDLQASLVRLIREGKVKNLDAKGARPKKPLHWDAGERLQLV
jgi:three-Cys-motif partner protein